MYLHNEREEFIDAINHAASKTGLASAIIEKDYYVTMILEKLAEKFDFIVFKGGTSLSKCYQVISRFSEDIDITIDTALTQGQKKQLKTRIIDLVDDLGMIIANIDDIRSRRDYNRYEISYNSVLDEIAGAVTATVLLETSFVEISFPTVLLPVHSYIGDLFLEEAPDAIKKYDLKIFNMKVQELNRTLIDKVFAVCDYYLYGKVERHSRHIYDIYKLYPLISLDKNFRSLVQEVRQERSKKRICQSAQPEVDVPGLLREIIKENVYKKDYNLLTTKLLKENIDYEEAIQALTQIAASEMFD